MPTENTRSGYKFVRQVRRKFQARVWLGYGKGGWLNLGLYSNGHDARRAVRDYFNDNRIPPHVLPRWVRRVAGGYAAWAKVNGLVFRTRVYRRPDAAHRAIRASIAGAFPAWVPVAAHTRKLRTLPAGQRAVRR